MFDNQKSQHIKYKKYLKEKIAYFEDNKEKLNNIHDKIYVSRLAMYQIISMYHMLMCNLVNETSKDWTEWSRSIDLVGKLWDHINEMFVNNQIDIRNYETKEGVSNDRKED